MNHQVFQVTGNDHTNMALSQLVASYRQARQVSIEDAYNFISFLSTDIHSDANTLAVSYELAKLGDIVEVLRAAKAALQTPAAYAYQGLIPLEILSMTYHVLAEQVEQSMVQTPSLVH